MPELAAPSLARSFELIVRTTHGQVRTLRVQASDASSACAQAAHDGHQVLGCTPRGRLRSVDLGTGAARRSALDIGNFAYELASLMAAGLSVMEALRTLAAKETAPANRAAVQDLLQAISQGMPLSAALDQAPGRYPPLLVATVAASEQTGNLSAALLRYASHQQTIKTLRDKVVGSAIYPALLLAVGCVVILFLVTVVVPKFAVLIESTRRSLPWSSRMLMSWGRFAADHRWELAAGTAVLLLAAGSTLRSLIRNGAKAVWLDAVPMVGSLVRRFRHAQLYRTTGMLVRGGIPVARALQLGANLLGDADRKRLEHAVTLLHEGRSLSDALQQARLADPVASSMLTVAERTGTLADILERIAEFYESRLQRSVDLTSRLFEPLLMIVIGLVVGAIVVLMYLPIFDLASSLQ